MVTPGMNDDAAVAAALLVGHTGAQDLEFGYLHDDVPTEQAAWWATAHYAGVKIGVENHTGPVQALEALAAKLLTGARCQWCQGITTLSADGAMVYPGAVMGDGSKMPTDPAELKALGQCLWRRNGQRWEPGCLHGQSTAPAAPQGRSAVRRLRRRYEASRPGAGR